MNDEGLWKFADGIKPGHLQPMFGFEAVMPRRGRARLVFDRGELALIRDDADEFRRMVADAVALDCVKGLERKCADWMSEMARGHGSPADAMMDGNDGIVLRKPYPWSPSNEIAVLDIARHLLRFPRGIPCRLECVAVDAPG